MRSSVEKRSVIVGKHKTSISLEDEFWTSVKEIAASRGTTCSGLLSEINEHRQLGNLSSAVRQFVLQFYQERARHSEDATPPLSLSPP
jgi:predicted DNA-binding ribbon-helix-helix protein